MSEEDKEFTPNEYSLSLEDLNNLQWAKDFMRAFETKEGERALTNRLRQNKYF
jgi:hypothetical protein